MPKNRWNTLSVTVSREISAKQDKVWELLTTDNPKFVSFFNIENTVEAYTCESPIKIGSVIHFKLKTLSSPITLEITHLREKSEIAYKINSKFLIPISFQQEIKIYPIDENKLSITTTTNFKSILAFFFRRKEEKIKEASMESLKKLEKWINDPSIEGSVQPVSNVVKSTRLKSFFKIFLAYLVMTALILSFLYIREMVVWVNQNGF